MVWTWQPAAAPDRFPKKRRKAEEKKQREEERVVVVVKAIIEKHPRSAGHRRQREEEGEEAEKGASLAAGGAASSPLGGRKVSLGLRLLGGSIMRERRYQGAMMLLTTAGAFCAFSLMTIAVGTDYWLYSRGMCRPKHHLENETNPKNEEVLTHSGLWRTCCTEGTYRGVCKDIEHFPEDAYEQDGAEYLLRVVRASSLFPIFSVCLLFLGGLCVAASEFYKKRHNIILTAGILFIAAGLSNVIGIIVYISAMSGDIQQDSKKTHEYGWSFNFGALSFVLAEMSGVLAIHVFIEKHRELRTKGRSSVRKPPAVLRSSSFYRNRYYNYNRSRRCSYRSNHSGGGGSFRHHASLQPRDSIDQNHHALAPPPGVPCVTPPLSVRSVTPPLQRGLSVTHDFMLYAMTTPLQAPAPPRDNGKVVAATGNNVNNATPNNVNNSLTGNCATSRRTTPV